MRKWHRWLSVFFGIFMLFIAVTGVLSQAAVLWPESAAEAVAREAAAIPPEGFECPEGWRCMPPRTETGIRGMVGLFHHLHSGEEFGPLGTLISVLSGFVLIFFSISGLWLYIRMWADRSKRGAPDRWFWK